MKDNNFYYNRPIETARFRQYVLEGEKFLVFDVETTGTHKNKDYVVEFSAIVAEKTDGYYEVVDKKEWLIKPPFLMSDEVVAIHGITNEMLADKPEERDVWPQINSFLQSHRDAVIMGYNVGFDIGFMQLMAKRNFGEFPWEEDMVIDVFKMVKENVFPDAHKGDRTLGHIAGLLLPGHTYTFHDSSEDIAATWDVAVELLKRRNRAGGLRPEDRKSKCRLNAYEFMRFGKMGHLFVWVTVDGKTYKLDYNTYHRCWAQKSQEETSIFRRVNMEALEEELNEVAKSKGKKSFTSLNDKQSFRRAG